MKKFRADLYNKRLDIYAEIELPATAEEISDALEQARDYNGNNKIATLNHFTDDLSFLSKEELKACSVYELNYFAEMLVEMNSVELMRFEGLVKSEFSASNEPEISDLINLIMHLKQCELMSAEASNDYELGKFYVDNDFIPEITENTQQWFIDHLDYKKIGKQMRDAENGQFVKGGYVVNTGEIKQLYDGKYPKPIPADYIFKLEIAMPSAPGLSANDQNTVTLKLPTSNTDCRNAIKQTGACFLNECVCYEFKSTIPQLGDIFTHLTDLESLNQLAMNIEGMKEFGDVTKYKAMLSTIGEPELTLETALEVCGYMSQFDMDYALNTPEEYAKFKTKDSDVPMKEELLKSANVYMYGEKLMRNHGATLTDYGMLIPFDGTTLKTYMQQADQGMTMGGVSR